VDLAGPNVVRLPNIQKAETHTPRLKLHPNEGVLAIDNRAGPIGHEDVAPDHQAVNPVRDDGLPVVE
jgi:hypothetical protein